MPSSYTDWHGRQPLWKTDEKFDGTINTVHYFDQVLLLTLNREGYGMTAEVIEFRGNPDVEPLRATSELMETVGKEIREFKHCSPDITKPFFTAERILCRRPEFGPFVIELFGNMLVEIKKLEGGSLIEEFENVVRSMRICAVIVCAPIAAYDNERLPVFPLEEIFTKYDPRADRQQKRLVTREMLSIMGAVNSKWCIYFSRAVKCHFPDKTFSYRHMLFTFAHVLLCTLRAEGMIPEERIRKIGTVI